jgi:hypothetical protein
VTDDAGPVNSAGAWLDHLGEPGRGLLASGGAAVGRAEWSGLRRRRRIAAAPAAIATSRTLEIRVHHPAIVCEKNHRDQQAGVPFQRVLIPEST